MAQLPDLPAFDTGAMAKQMYDLFEIFGGLVGQIADWSMASPMHMAGTLSVIFLLFYATVLLEDDMADARRERREYPCAQQGDSSTRRRRE